MSDFGVHPIGAGKLLAAVFEDSESKRLTYVRDGKGYDVENLVDALDHIKRIAHMSSRMSKRVYWIAQRASSALEGDEKWREFDYPRDRKREDARLRAKNREMKLLLKMVSANLHNPQLGGISEDQLEAIDDVIGGEE